MIKISLFLIEMSTKTVSKETIFVVFISKTPACEKKPVENFYKSAIIKI